MSISVPSEAARTGLSAENTATLEELVRTVDYADGLTLLFARCNIPTLRRRLAREASQHLATKGIQVIELEFSPGVAEVYQWLRERLADLLQTTNAKARKVVFLCGLEHSIPGSMDLNGSDLQPPLLTELNMGRELFHQDAPHPLVFWLPDYAITALARGAPDFWAWRSGVFEFETEPGYREEAFRVYAREGRDWLVLGNLTAEQKRRRRAILESLLAEYHQLERDQRIQHELVEILFTLGQLNQSLGDLQAARQLYQQNLEIAEKLRHQKGSVAILHNLGMIAQDQGDYETARKFYQRSLEIKEKLGNQAGIATTVHNLGVIAQGQGDYEAASQFYQRSLEIVERLGDQAGIAGALHQLGTIAQEQGNYDAARSFYQQSLEIFVRLKSPYAERVRQNLANLDKQTAELTNQET